MTLPTFLGIGVPKGGTTWLRELLITHPDVYIPQKTKGIRYFDHYFDLGPEWYQEFFPTDTAASKYKAIGEISAHYLYYDECPQRISDQLDRPKLFLNLRNPVDRTWSHYKHIARLNNYQKSFDLFLEDYPGALRFSHYAAHIKRYKAIFDPDQLSILMFDRIFKDIEKTRREIANFLGIDPGAFPESSGKNVVNKGFTPRYRNVYAMVARAQWLTRSNQVHWPGHLAKKMGIKRLISMSGEKSEPMSDETRQWLLAYFDQEISELETVLQTDLSHWRS